MTLASATAVTRRFGDLTAVESVSMKIDEGEIVGLIGANGAGKTTLLRMLLGLLTPTAGRVELFGQPPSLATRRRIGYVPQGLGLYEDLTVEENRDFVLQAFDRPIRRRKPHSSGHLVRELSLGERRRTAFDVAIAHDPDLLILDEPTSGVGPLERAALWDQIAEAAERGVGVLVTTHYMNEAEQCDRLVVLARGRVVGQGSVGDMLGSEEIAAVYTDRWADALRVLRDAGIPAALVGGSLRIVAGTDDVGRILRDGGVTAQVRSLPASFEEVFSRLVDDGRPAEAIG